MERLELSLPPAMRGMNLDWVILGGGPNRDGWHEYAETHGSHVFAMNGTITICPNPSAYIATDRISIKAFEAFWSRLDCPRYIGREEVKAVNNGLYTIAGLEVRTVAMWAAYLALSIYHASSVRLFGVYGAEDGEWHTVSNVGGRFNGRAKYAAAAAAAGIADPQVAVLLHQGLPDESNLNTATLIIKMREMFRESTIELHGDGPVAKILKRMEDEQCPTTTSTRLT